VIEPDEITDPRVIEFVEITVPGDRPWSRVIERGPG
jgi:hypothetical protein